MSCIQFNLLGTQLPSLLKIHTIIGHETRLSVLNGQQSSGTFFSLNITHFKSLFILVCNIFPSGSIRRLNCPQRHDDIFVVHCTYCHYYKLKVMPSAPTFIGFQQSFYCSVSIFYLIELSFLCSLLLFATNVYSLRPIIMSFILNFFMTNFL